MSLDGLRAWIGEVERKLGARTRVFLALTVIAIGIAGAAVYLAIDARNSSVSEGDVQALQQELEAQIDEAGAAAATSPIEPQAEAGSEPEPAPEAEPKAETKGAGGAANGATNSSKLEELAEEAKERAEGSE